MDIEQFSMRVQTLRRPTGHSQEELADALGIRRQVLARKFLGKAAHFTHNEIKQIIKTLAEWDAITTISNAQELLALMDLPMTSFSTAEWATVPLAKLEKKVEWQSYSLPDQSQKAVSNNLPLPLTDLIGRERLVRLAIEKLRQPGVRLLTLLGPGGIGKTRLSLEIGRQLRHEFKQQVFFIDLSNLTRAEQVPERLAQGLGIDARVDITAELKHYLAEHQCLIILDNFEHLLPAADLIGELLQAAPDLKLLVTSRAALQIYGETQLGIPPLDLPDLEQLPLMGELTDLLRFESIQLFVARVQAIQPTFQLTPANIEEIARLCVLLEGMPLSLELAAACVKILPLPYLHERLSESKLETLYKGSRNLPLRHQTLRATIEWSYGLLDEPTRRMFNYLGIFRGSFSLDAVQKICYGNNRQPDVMERLGELVDQSLLKPQEGLTGEPRFVMLDTLREFAALKLQESGEQEQLQARYYHYYLQLLEKWTIAFTTDPADQFGLTTILEQDYENYLAAHGYNALAIDLNQTLKDQIENRSVTKSPEQLQTQLTIVIRQPVEVVFEYVSMVENWPEWNSFISKGYYLQPGPPRVGMTVRVISMLWGRPIEQTMLITEFIPSKYLEAQIYNSAMKEKNQFIFSEKDGQTSLTFITTSNINQLFQFTRPVMSNLLRHAQEIQFNKLKTTLETVGRFSGTKNPGLPPEG